jgi:hypothetical protein
MQESQSQANFATDTLMIIVAVDLLVAFYILITIGYGGRCCVRRDPTVRGAVYGYGAQRARRPGASAGKEPAFFILADNRLVAVASNYQAAGAGLANASAIRSTRLREVQSGERGHSRDYPTKSFGFVFLRDGSFAGSIACGPYCKRRPSHSAGPP